MIVALAGRRIDASNAETPRFPLPNILRVRGQLRSLFLEMNATVLVCSAACGADLLALDAAGELGLRQRVILPFSPDRFRELSVADRPGDWGPLFDTVIERVKASSDLVVLHDIDGDELAFAVANVAILNEAIQLSHTRHGTGGVNDEVVAVVVWDGTPRGDDDLTAAFASEAHTLGIAVTEVPTQ